MESDKVFKDTVWNQIKCLRIPSGIEYTMLLMYCRLQCTVMTYLRLQSLTSFKAKTYDVKIVISEVYAFCVLQCTSKEGCHSLTKKNQWNILVMGNYHVNYQNEMLLSSSDTRGTLMHLFLSTNTAQPRENWFQLYAENTQTQLTFLALLPCIVLTTIWFNEKQEGVKPRRCSWTA